jgi:hypothetical protein
MKIAPSLAIWLTIAYGVLSGLSVKAIEALGFHAHASVIYAWCGLGAVVISTILHAYSSSDPGPLAPPDPLVVKEAQALADLPATATSAAVANASARLTAAAQKAVGLVLFALVIAGLIALAPSARAGESPEAFNAAAKAPLRIPSAASSAIVDAAGGALSDIAAFFATDFDAAQKLATQIPGLQDYNGQACWRQLSSVGALIKAHPLPATLHAATDVQAMRLFALAINQACANPACTQVFADLANGVSQIGVGVAVPSLSALCGKVPTITVGAPPIGAPLGTPPAN